MNLQSSTPSSGGGRTARNVVRRSGAIPYMSERQIQAYLLARDALRRIRRTPSLVDATSPRAARDSNPLSNERRPAG